MNEKKIGQKPIESIVFCWLFFQMTTNDFVYKLMPNFFIPSFVMAVMPVIAAWLCILFQLKNIFYIHGDALIFIICVIFMLICALAGNDFLREIVFSSSFFMLITACIFVYTRSSNIHSLFTYINIICILSGLIVCIYALTFIGFDYSKMENSYMAIGYNLSLFSLILFECYRINQKKVNLLFAIIFSLFILIFGNRGAFIVLITYFIIKYIILQEHALTKKRIIFGFILVLIGIAFINFFEEIISFMSLTLKNIGISSRSFEKLLSNSFSQSEGRNEIYEVAFEIIRNNPIEVRGPGYLTTIYISKQYQHANAHNILLELLVEYGCIFGFILFFIIIKKIIISIKSLKYNKNIENSISACFLIQAIVQLSFSTTFYSSNEFWLGLVIIGILSRREKLCQKFIHMHGI